MPELPEVEVVKRSLNQKIKNLIIKRVKVHDPNLRYKVKKEEIIKLIGKKIKKIERRSKFLIFKLNKEIFMLAHLGMTGKFYFVNRKKKKFKTSFYYELKENDGEKHDRIVFTFQDNKKLIYNDVRKFGFFKFYNSEKISFSSHLKNLGPEPFEKKFNINYFKNFILGKKTKIKNILMNQKFISGLGNIYVNEILFLSGVKPARNVSKLKDFEIRKIIKNTKKILNTSIKLGGSSIKDFSSGDGKKGDFQQFFNVYGRKDEKCPNTYCKLKVLRTIISNRATFFCKGCQK